MKEKKFFIYLDILGFKDLPREIKGNAGFYEDIIRERFLSEPLREKIMELGGKGIQYTKGISAIEGSDNYVLLVDDEINTLFKVMAELLMIKIYNEYCNFIPLEIAVDLKEIGIRVKDPINQREVIDFLKTDIINPYRKIYREKHGEQSIIKDTFILFTNAAFAELKEHSKKECVKYNYSKKDKNGNVHEYSFYFLPLSIVERERKISDYFEEIHQSRSDYNGALIDKIFVPPDEYDEIKAKLKKDRIVFITGTVGCGKTYTAIRLLWEWFENGYTPKLIPGKEPDERKDARDILANIEAELKSNHVIYFEDPFGKTRYERRDDLKERINVIISAIKNKNDVYVIFTSRKDVYEEFKRESYLVEEIKRFENELNIIKPSYSYEKRKEIIEKWAEEKGCEWLMNQELKDFVIKSIKDKEVLPTPLSIHDFIATTIKVNKKENLRSAIDGYSKIVEKAFADEIIDFCRYGREDRVLFLLLIFISQDFNLEFVKQIYERLKKEGFRNYESILREEYRVKVIESCGRGKILEFSHPSYAHALSYILCDDTCNGKFCDVLKELSQDANSDWSVARAVAKNFDKLPMDVKNLLPKLLENDETARECAEFVEDNFIELPVDGRNKLLSILSEKYDRYGTISIIVAENFNNLPEYLKNLLFRFSESENVYPALTVAVALAGDYAKSIPADMRGKLLLRLSEKHKIARLVASVVVVHIEDLPDNMRDELLFKLIEEYEVDEIFAAGIAKHFNNLPEHVRNLLDRRLQNPLKMVIERACSNRRIAEKKFALQLISNAWTKIDKNFLSEVLDKLFNNFYGWDALISEEERAKVRKEAGELLKAIFGDGVKKRSKQQET